MGTNKSPDTHFVLLPRTPWGGPSASCINGPALDLHCGVLMEPPNEMLRYELKVEPDADDPLAFPPLDLHDANNGHLLMSERLVQCLENVGVSNIQYFPAEAIYLPTGSMLRYKTGNIVGLVDALDTSAAECEIDETGFVEVFYTLRLKHEAIADFDIFRMHENAFVIVVSARVKHAIESQQLVGIRFATEEEWGQ